MIKGRVTILLQYIAASSICMYPHIGYGESSDLASVRRVRSSASKILAPLSRFPLTWREFIWGTKMCDGVSNVGCSFTNVWYHVYHLYLTMFHYDQEVCIYFQYFQSSSGVCYSAVIGLSCNLLCYWDLRIWSRCCFLNIATD